MKGNYEIIVCFGWQTLEGKERMKMWEIQQKKKKINKEWNKNFKRCRLKFSTLTNFDVAPLKSREDSWLSCHYRHDKDESNSGWLV